MVRSIRVLSGDLLSVDSLRGTLKSTGNNYFVIDVPSPVLNILSNEDCSVTVNSPTTYDSKT